MVKSIALLSLAILVLSACGKNDCDEVILDSVKFHDTTVYSESTYYLYSRTTGFHEKVVFFEVYDREPEFNKCRNANITPVFARAFDDSEEQPYLKELIFQPDSPEKLKIIYTKNKEEGFANVYDVKFSGW